MSNFRRPNSYYENPSPIKNQNYPYPKSKIFNDNNINNNNNSMFLLQKQDNRIDSSALPSPSEFEDYFKNSDNKNIYYTQVGSHPPHSTSKFIVKETENSSCRIIRSSFIYLPINQNILLKTGVSFGLYCQPFADFNDNEKSIPIVDGSKGIFRCKSCNSYINNKYNLTYNKKSQRILICNICQNENILNNNNTTHEKYLEGNGQENYELMNPTIDFIPSESLTKNVKKFIPHYCIMIDISSILMS